MTVRRRRPVPALRHDAQPVLPPHVQGGERSPMPSIQELLQSFIKVRGVRSALVVGSDGLVLESSLSSEGEPVDVDAVGAVAASGLVPALELGIQTGHGSLTQAIYEYRDALIVIEALGDDAVLVIVTDLLANLGLLRLQARKARPDLARALRG